MQTFYQIITMLHPGIIMIIAGISLFFIRKREITILFTIFIPLLVLILLTNLWFLHDDIVIDIAKIPLVPVHFHDYSLIVLIAFLIAFVVGAIYALGDRKYHGDICAAFIYAGSAIGVVLAGDLISFFIMWEVMTLGAVLIILNSDSPKAKGAAFRYITMHIFGGVLLLAGITLNIKVTGNVDIPSFGFTASQILDFNFSNLKKLSGLLMLVGILVNAAAPPFSSWLADAYPTATPAGTVFLSTFTTKTAVFALITIFAGSSFLIYIGIFMVFYGIVYAIIENDMRRILSYSIINQVGFMITAIGIGTPLALGGAAIHLFCHIMYKSLLMMSAGAVLYTTGKSRCTDLGGLYRTMRLTCIFGIVGALAISAFPFTSGYISKSLIVSAAEGRVMLWLLLVAASAGVFFHAGIKFPWFVFFQKDSGLRPNDAPGLMILAMSLMAVMCIAPGIFPQALYALVPNKINYQPYTIGHVVNQLQLLTFAGIAFFAALPALKRTETISLDFDWSYRVFVYKIATLTSSLAEFIAKNSARFFSYTMELYDSELTKRYGHNGSLTKSPPIASILTNVIVFLLILLMLLYAH
jgi:multicomponent Na+:H+ antiporter subunit D